MNFRDIIRKIVSIFASPEFAFVYCVVGTLAQTSHTYYLVDSISSLTGWSKALQGYALSFFISSSLLFFTAIADESDDSKQSKRVLLAVNLFMVIEILINIYYYGSYLVLKQSEPRIYDFIFALLISCMIPVTIKLYAGVIRAKEWIDVVASVEQQKTDENVVTSFLNEWKTLREETNLKSGEIQLQPIKQEPITEDDLNTDNDAEISDIKDVESSEQPEPLKITKPTIIKINRNNDESN